GALRLERRRQDARERLVQQELWADEERLRRRLATEEEERRREAAIKEQLRQLKLDAARERLQEAMSPLEEGARQLHAAVYEAAAPARAPPPAVAQQEERCLQRMRPPASPRWCGSWTC